MNQSCVLYPESCNARQKGLPSRRIGLVSRELSTTRQLQETISGRSPRLIVRMERTVHMPISMSKVATNIEPLHQKAQWIARALLRTSRTVSVFPTRRAPRRIIFMTICTTHCLEEVSRAPLQDYATARNLHPNICRTPRSAAKHRCT